MGLDNSEIALKFLKNGRVMVVNIARRAVVEYTATMDFVLRNAHLSLESQKTVHFFKMNR